MEQKFVFGDKVKLLLTEGSKKECGIVVHSWFDDEFSIFYYTVVFFGNAFPVGEPDSLPYVLRYSEGALEKY